LRPSVIIVLVLAICIILLGIRLQRRAQLAAMGD
jgi:hypothetical protein